jgi:hypothetical protein
VFPEKFPFITMTLLFVCVLEDKSILCDKVSSVLFNNIVNNDVENASANLAARGVS